MADFLTNLIARTREPTAAVRPRLTALFEPVVQLNVAADGTREPQPVNDLLIENETVSTAGPIIRPHAIAPQPEPLSPIVMTPPEPRVRTQAPPVISDAADRSESETSNRTTFPQPQPLRPEVIPAAEPTARTQAPHVFGEAGDRPSETSDRKPAVRRDRPLLNEASESVASPTVEIGAIEVRKPEVAQIADSTASVEITTPALRPQIASETPPRMKPITESTFTESNKLAESHEVIDEERPGKRVRKITTQESAQPVNEFEREQSTGPIQTEVSPRIRQRDVKVVVKPELHQPEVTAKPDHRIADPGLTSNSAPITAARRVSPPEPAGSAAAEPVINVTIGHVEVRAVSPPARAVPDRGRAPKLMTLDDYLRQRAEGGRR